MRRVGGQRRKGGNCEMKKWVGRWPKREELLINGFIEEIGLPMTDTGHKEWWGNWQSMLQKEWRSAQLKIIRGTIHGSN